MHIRDNDRASSNWNHLHEERNFTKASLSHSLRRVTITGAEAAPISIVEH